MNSLGGGLEGNRQIPSQQTDDYNSQSKRKTISKERYEELFGGIAEDLKELERLEAQKKKLQGRAKKKTDSNKSGDCTIL